MLVQVLALVLDLEYGRAGPAGGNVDLWGWVTPLLFLPFHLAVVKDLTVVGDRSQTQGDPGYEGRSCFQAAVQEREQPCPGCVFHWDSPVVRQVQLGPMNEEC